jgi:glycosyltransferase involved in cell wall biosynthesis
LGDIADPVDTRDPRIAFVGAKDNPYAHMRRFDIFTLPSRDDPFPLVVLESMLLGKPVVAFGVGGVPRQLGDAGVLVPPGDVELFAAAIADLIRNPEARARYSASARERVESQFSVETFAGALHEMLQPRSTTFSTSSR